ncbi:PHP domain-containing protein [Nanoarchaeota archaeon]
MFKKKVLHGKKKIKMLKKLGFNVFDMHVHTNYSDGADTPQEILKQAKKLGIGVAITDHNEIGGCVEALKNDHGVLVIPGIEITSYEGWHVLLYFSKLRDLQEFFREKLDNGKRRIKVEHIPKLKEKFDFLVSMAHPNGHFPWHNWKPNFKLKGIDAFEVFNAGSHPGQNKNSFKWARKFRKGLTGGSDAHLLNDLGTTITACKAKTVDKLLESIKRNETIVAGEHISFYRFALRYAIKLPVKKTFRSIKYSINSFLYYLGITSE